MRTRTEQDGKRASVIKLYEYSELNEDAQRAALDSFERERADFWRKEIESHKEKAANCKAAAKEHAEKARALREDAKRDREAAARELETAREFTEKLEAYRESRQKRPAGGVKDGTII